jgi:hypothetical protein
MGRIVQQILDEMSSGSGILLFLQIILFDTAHSFTGIEFKLTKVATH